MAEIVNLRMVRKRKQRADAQSVAEANRLLHGRSKTEKRVSDAEREAAIRHLDGHRRDAPDDK
ncbi:MAG: DUF4169 family protein [Mesorhizobium sp.]